MSKPKPKPLRQYPRKPRNVFGPGAALAANIDKLKRREAAQRKEPDAPPSTK